MDSALWFESPKLLDFLEFRFYSGGESLLCLSRLVAQQAEPPQEPWVIG